MPLSDWSKFEILRSDWLVPLPLPYSSMDKHLGSGIMVDNIFKAIRRILSPVVKKFAKQSGNKALKSGVSHLSERVNKKTSEKSGDLIMKKLRNMRMVDARQKALTPPIKQQQQEESTDMIINRLISGSGMKRR